MTPSPYGETLTRRFYAWESRGRGAKLLPFLVSLEPPFRPFIHRCLSPSELDDGRHHTLLSALLERFSKKQEPPPLPEVEIEPETAPADGDPVELRLLLPKDLTVTLGLSEGFLKSLTTVHRPLSVELVGAGSEISVVLTARSQDVPLLASQVRAFFPGVSLEEGEEILLSAWEAGAEGVFLAAEWSCPGFVDTWPLS
jgi:hypothetical protein